MTTDNRPTALPSAPSWASRTEPRDGAVVHSHVMAQTAEVAVVIRRTDRQAEDGSFTIGDPEVFVLLQDEEAGLDLDTASLLGRALLRVVTDVRLASFIDPDES